MKRAKRILFVILILILLVASGGYFLLHHIKRAALPDYSKDVQLEGLQAEVTVFRDGNAIPHVYAENEADLYRAVGFVMAQDRLWQLDLLRRVTQGRLSEIFGSGMVRTDHLMRALRIPEKSEKLIGTASPEIRTALEAFADGVNHYMENYPLPPEYKVLGYSPDPWEPVHSINLIGYMSWDLTSGWETELLMDKVSKEVSREKMSDLIPEMKNHPEAVFPETGFPEGFAESSVLAGNDKLKELGMEIFHGSNNWAVAGQKSQSGKPLLANDMHLGLFAPGIWYQMHQVVKGKLNVTGLVLPGQPFVIAGHNDSIAWGMTNVMVDDLDFYEETLNDDTTNYFFDGEWKNLVIKDEEIAVKGEKPVVRRIRFTHRGPLVSELKNIQDKAISIRWIGNGMSNELRTVYLLNRAANWEDFREAVKTFTSVSQNIVYADVQGNIGLQTCAGVPIREGNGIQVYPGDSSRYDWQGLVPFEQLPYAYNPDRGYVSSANNKTVPEDYPWYISHWFATPDRITRIREMLEAKEKLDVAGFQAMQSDLNSALADRMMPHLLPALKNHPAWNATEQAALELLAPWDGKLTKESQATSLFEILYRKVPENLIRDDLSAETFNQLKNSRMILENLMINILPEKSSPWIDDISTPEKESFEDLVVRSFSETVADLTILMGGDPESWHWERIHTFTLAHPMGTVSLLDKALNLNRGPFGVPGSYHTVCPYSYSWGNLYHVNNGASHRHIFDLSNWDASLTILPTGTSGIPASDFYCDQTERYLNNQYHADPFSAENVEAAALFEMKIQPEN